MQVLVINPYPRISMTSVAETPAPTTREEMVSYFNSDVRSQSIRLERTLEKLLEFELNNWEPIHSSRWSWNQEVSEPPVDGPKLLDLYRQTFTWKENIRIQTEVYAEGQNTCSVRCKDREDFKKKMSCDDLSMDIEWGYPGDEDPSSEHTFMDPYELDLCVSRTRTYAPDVTVSELQLRDTPKEQGLAVFRNHLLKMHKEDLELMSHLTAEDILTTIGGIPFLALGASSKEEEQENS